MAKYKKCANKIVNEGSAEPVEVLKRQYFCLWSSGGTAVGARSEDANPEAKDRVLENFFEAMQSCVDFIEEVLGSGTEKTLVSVLKLKTRCIQDALS